MTKESHWISNFSYFHNTLLCQVSGQSEAWFQKFSKFCEYDIKNEKKSSVFPMHGGKDHKKMFKEPGIWMTSYQPRSEKKNRVHSFKKKF